MFRPTSSLETIPTTRYAFLWRLQPPIAASLLSPLSSTQTTAQVVNTLLVTPNPPRATGGSGKTACGVWDTRVRLRWDAPGGGGTGGSGGGVGGGGGPPAVAGGGGGNGVGVGAGDKAATQILQQVFASVCFVRVV